MVSSIVLPTWSVVPSHQQNQQHRSGVVICSAKQISPCSSSFQQLRHPSQMKAFAPICRASSSVKSENVVSMLSLASNQTEVDADIQPLTLASIRDSLVHQEDTIIYGLLKRAQFGFNGPTYDKDCFSIPGFQGSLLEYMLKETEHLHAKVRRYQAPDEHPFFPEGLPAPILPDLSLPKVLHPVADSININKAVWNMYLEDLLPKITSPEDDGNYGSASVCDVLCLQALSKRIHYGKFVAEAKFTEDPKRFESHIRAQDGDAIMRELTYKNVEDNVKRRVANKARTYGQEVDSNGKAENAKYKIDPDLAGALYEDWVMPLTKNVQVMYLLRRLD